MPERRKRGGEGGKRRREGIGNKGIRGEKAQVTRG
jgi:hypothetical protein